MLHRIVLLPKGAYTQVRNPPNIWDSECVQIGGQDCYEIYPNSQNLSLPSWDILYGKEEDCFMVFFCPESNIPFLPDRIKEISDSLNVFTPALMFCPLVGTH